MAPERENVTLEGRLLGNGRASEIRGHDTDSRHASRVFPHDEDPWSQKRDQGHPANVFGRGAD
jgi:hypothetical protein